MGKKLGALGCRFQPLPAMARAQEALCPPCHAGTMANWPVAGSPLRLPTGFSGGSALGLICIKHSQSFHLQTIDVSRVWWVRGALSNEIPAILPGVARNRCQRVAFRPPPHPSGISTLLRAGHPWSCPTWPAGRSPAGGPFFSGDGKRAFSCRKTTLKAVEYRPRPAPHGTPPRTRRSGLARSPPACRP